MFATTFTVIGHINRNFIEWHYSCYVLLYNEVLVLLEVCEGCPFAD